jgi:hypothetical protein
MKIGACYRNVWKKLAFGITMSLLLQMPCKVNAQTLEHNPEAASEELVKMGFENVRWTDTESERVYTVENTAYRLNGVGVAHAVDVIRRMGLPTDKPCKLIVTKMDVPQIALTYTETATPDSVSAPTGAANWDVAYELGDSWDAVKHAKKKNSSFGKVDILVYPQLSFMNMVITQIYQVLFDLSPSVEVTLWKGAKLAAMVKIPVYNDGYGIFEGKVHPGHITLSQRFRLPYNVFGRATVGYYNYDRYGLDVDLTRPFRDERFSVEARAGYLGVAYWNGFRLHYDTSMDFYWQVGGNFYWPKYNTQFSLKFEKFLMSEHGVKFEMIRHFRYASIGFYAMKAEWAKSNGGFRFQVALPPYRQKRHGYIPRISTSNNMGIAYNAGNERYYYREYRAEASDNIMESNSFNPYFIKSELLNLLNY